MSPAQSHIQATYEQIQATKSRNECYPESFKQLVADYAHPLRHRGWSWRVIADTLPISSTSVRRWTLDYQRSTRASTMLPVIVRDEPQDTHTGDVSLTLTSPNGFRVDGLDVEQLTHLLTKLG